MGQEVMIIGTLVLKSWVLDANMSGWGGCYGYQAKFCEGQDKVTFANKGGRNPDEEE